jgi:magnesium-transporting ATPase (P-type)
MIIVNDKNNETVYKYELLNVIEFTSTRKRMSVIVRD